MLENGEQKTIPVWDVEIVAREAHTSSYFTQGLVVSGDRRWISFGLYGESGLACYERGEKQPIWKMALGSEYFGEGLCKVGGLILQLTWREQTALVWSADSGRICGEIEYRDEGWGITESPGGILTSNGSDIITIRNENLVSTAAVAIRMAHRPVVGFNDLTWGFGRLWANIYGTSYIVSVDMVNGTVVDVIDASVVRAIEPLGAGLMNGLDWSERDGVLWMTGKNWMHLYGVRLRSKRREDIAAIRRLLPDEVGVLDVD